MPLALNDKLHKLKEFSGIGSFVPAAAIAFSAFSGRTAVTAKNTEENKAQIENLQKQVSALQLEVAQNQVIAARVQGVDQKVDMVNANVKSLGDELHSWQREERRFHNHEK